MDPEVWGSDPTSSHITLQMQIYVNPTEDFLELFKATLSLASKPESRSQ